MSDELKGKALGTILVQSQMVTQEQIEHALEIQKSTGRRLGEILVELGVVSSEDVRWGLSQQQSYSFVRLKPENVDLNALREVPADVARRLRVVPYLLVENELTVVMDDPTDKRAIEELTALTGRTVIAAVGLSEEISETLDVCYGKDETVNLEKTVIEEVASLLHERPGLFLITGPRGSATYKVLTTLVRVVAQPEQRVLHIGYSGVALDPGVLKLPSIKEDKPEKALEMALGLAPDLLSVEDLFDAERINLALRAAASGCRVLAILPIAWPEVAMEYLIEQSKSRAILACVFCGAVAVVKDNEEYRGFIVRSEASLRNAIRTSPKKAGAIFGRLVRKGKSRDGEA